MIRFLSCLCLGLVALMLFACSPYAGDKEPESAPCELLTRWDQTLKEEIEVPPLVPVRSLADLSWLPETTSAVRCEGIDDGVLLKLAERNAITRIHFQACEEVTAVGMERLKALEALEVLDLAGCTVEDHWLGPIGEMPGLLDLYLSGQSGLSHGAISRLAAASGVARNRLRKLDLSFCGVSDAWLEALEPLAGLTELNLEANADLTLTSIRRLAELPMLSDLDLSGCAVTDAWLSEMAEWPALRRLALRGSTEVQQFGMEALAQSPALEELDLRSCGVRDAWLAVLSGMASLRALWLAGNVELSASGIGELGALSQLERLYLSGLMPGNSLVDRLKDMRELKLLDVSWTGIAESSLEGLSELPMLRRLDLRGLSIGARGLAWIAQIASLETLIVGGAGLEVSSSGMEALSEMPNLMRLSIVDAPLLEDSVVAKLAGSKTLRRLDASDCDALHGTFCRAFQREASCLEELRLRGCDGLSDAGLALVHKLHNLRRIELADGGAVGGYTLARLELSPTIERVDLSGQMLDALAIKTLVRFPNLKVAVLEDVEGATLEAIRFVQREHDIDLVY